MSNTFNDIDDKVLRTWNRCAMAFNLREDKDEEAAQAYLESIDELGRQRMYLMFKMIELRGYEAVKREVFKRPSAQQEVVH